MRRRLKIRKPKNQRAHLSTKRRNPRKIHQKWLISQPLPRLFSWFIRNYLHQLYQCQLSLLTLWSLHQRSLLLYLKLMRYNHLIFWKRILWTLLHPRRLQFLPNRKWAISFKLLAKLPQTSNQDNQLNHSTSPLWCLKTSSRFLSLFHPCQLLPQPLHQPLLWQPSPWAQLLTQFKRRKLMLKRSTKMLFKRLLL